MLGQRAMICLQIFQRRQGLAPHETKMIGTGVALAVPEGYFGGVFARSGLSAKEGLRPANCTGVVDADYRGEVKVALHNDSEEERVVAPGPKDRTTGHHAISFRRI